jgi:hypothetical protein
VSDDPENEDPRTMAVINFKIRPDLSGDFEFEIIFRTISRGSKN